MNEAVLGEHLSNYSQQGQDKTTAYNDDDDLYSYLYSSDHPSQSCSVEREVGDYLASKWADVLGLIAFPEVALVSKSQSTLPSSAAVERIFGFAGLILPQRRCKIS